MRERDREGERGEDGRGRGSGGERDGDIPYGSMCSFYIN